MSETKSHGPQITAGPGESTKTLIVGIGSPHGDDQAGWMVADGLKSEPDCWVRTSQIPLDVIDWIEPDMNLHLIDASADERSPDGIRRLCWPADRELLLAASSNQATHGYGVVSVLKLAESLQRLPPRVTVWTITGRNFEPFTSLSAAVAARVEKIVGMIREDLNHA